jgi:hypothetical protein
MRETFSRANRRGRETSRDPRPTARGALRAPPFCDSDHTPQCALSNFRAPWWICNVSSEKIDHEIPVLMRSKVAASLDF